MGLCVNWSVEVLLNEGFCNNNISGGRKLHNSSYEFLMWESVVYKSTLLAKHSHFQLNISLRMCEGIIGCFQLTESDNFEEYLEALEIPVPMRKMMALAKPKVR